ncbi:sulfite exporter TauE/SafE family protein [Arsenicitalea aurantiaca]|uniref:Probable membrane transporter protein n=1 Tax=Arsenicitalea aurantiaca TaxID=1783274 RepID=A0A433XKY5_9HYPH|nr:sulfite exporter TauE/SafE family protein [Arsenicitalea aurantiaca]RUT34747.1 sulfite exporter TauE/SafE family protein [Arsenicitalea aurantiaca]
MSQDLLMDYGVWTAAMVFAGLMGGFVAGLLGVGGGIVIVPILYFVLGGMGVDDDIRMKIAVATSLTTIVFTSLSSAGSHYRKGAVDFDLLKSWGVPIFIGVVVGTAIGGAVSGLVLTLVFAVVALLVALNMVLRAQSAPLRDGFPNRIVKAIAGFFVGSVSAMMGIGGGTLSVPILTAFGYDIRRAVGTAAAIGFIIAIPGTIGYAIAGWGEADLPAGSLGYVNLLALVALAPLTMLVAPLGARVAHNLQRRTLSYAFAAFLFVTSVRMFIDIWQGL